MCMFTHRAGGHGASERTLGCSATLVSVSMVRDHSVTSSSQQVREDSTERRSSHRSLLM